MAAELDYSVFDNLLEGCQVIDGEYRYRYLNKVVTEQAKMSQQQLLGHTMMESFPGIETTPMFSRIQDCMTTRTPSSMENRFVYPDGSADWFLLKIQPVEAGVLILSIGITEMKRTEKELGKQIQRLEALREIDIAIVNTTNAAFALKTILEKVTATLGVDSADVLFFHADTNTLDFVAGRGFRTKGIEKTHLRVGQGHAGQAASRQKTEFIPDLRRNREEFLRWPLIEGEDFVTYSVVPLLSRGTLLGVMEVFHRSLLEPDAPWFEFLEALAGQSSIAIDSGRLFDDLKHTNMDLMLAYETTIEGWSKALDLRDKETEGHTLRVTAMTERLAVAAGFSGSELVQIRRGALLHDIGKMGVPDAILLKPGSLTDEEWVLMKKHPTFARDLLYPIEYLRPCLAIPYSHHEKFDGSGYPQGLRGDQIPLPARLFAIVDVWDALRNDRPYRKAWTEEAVVSHIHDLVGTHFDPLAAQIFFSLLEHDQGLAGSEDQTE